MLVVFLAFWSLQGHGFTWCLGGNGLESVSTFPTLRTADNLRLVAGKQHSVLANDSLADPRSCVILSSFERFVRVWPSGSAKGTGRQARYRGASPPISSAFQNRASEASVYADVLARDVAGSVGRQKSYRRRDLVAGPIPTHWHHLSSFLGCGKAINPSQASHCSCARCQPRTHRRTTWCRRQGRHETPPMLGSPPLAQMPTPWRCSRSTRPSAAA